ncbi:amidohydrolase family protein [[Eubacterium] cellulosolvens]
MPSEKRYIFDAHAHVSDSDIPEYVAKHPDVLIEDMTQNGITKCCIMGSLPLTKMEMIKNNDFIAWAKKKYPEKLPYGIATINPRLGDIALKEVDRSLQRLDLQGIKLLPPYQNFHVASEIVLPVYDLCEKYNASVHIHTDWVDARCNPQSCSTIAAEYPKVTFFLCHTPREPINYASNMMCTHALEQKNIVLDLTMAMESEIENLIKGADSGRIVFGSDWPYFSYRQNKAKMEVLDLPAGVKERIFALNLAKILGVSLE